jgi:outer membrane protein assembly factor BamA
MYPDLRIGERNLARLGIFKCSPDGSVRPTIEVVDNPNVPESEFKDVIIHVEETDTAHARFKPGFDSKGTWVYQILVEERNWDPFRWPTSEEDITEGRAWRGAGLAIGVDFQFKVPLHPVCVPSVSLQIAVPYLSLKWNEPWLLVLPREKTRP